MLSRVFMGLAVLMMFAVLVSMIAVGCWSGDAEAKTADALATCRGSYHFVGGGAQRATRDAAIDRAARDVNWFVRGIARSHLTKAADIPNRLVVDARGSDLIVTADGHPYVAPVDGRQVDVEAATGDKLGLSHELLAGGVREIFRKGKHGKANVYRCGPDRLEVAVSIFSPKLPKPVRYQLSYRRDQ
jgi:hypothetical protein